MKFQPDAWGLTFCPAARMHQAQITALVGGQLSSGDWFVPAKAKAYGDKLEQFFGSVKSISYMKQAGGLLTLARSAAHDGLSYAGYVGIDGRPNYLDPPAGGEVWGGRATDRQPVFLAVKMAPDQPLREAVPPLSPLFALPHPTGDFLTAAGVDAADPSFQGALPPLFAGPPRP